jgi:uncharacterized protein (DUF1697 family)
MASTYVALFRGVNVGGNNKLPMKDLADIFQKSGCGNVRAYIQSGNVVFDCPTSVERLRETVGLAIEKKFGFNPSLVLRKLADLEEIVRNNPFLKAGVQETELHVVFLADEPKAADIATLDRYKIPPDDFAVRGKEIFLRLPNGAGRSKLAGAPFHTKLNTTATARNWRTVNKLIGIMKG